jgi:hypothetical protein
MTTKQLNAIKDVCRKVHKMCYTANYKVSMFKVTPYKDNTLQVDFQITRVMPFGKELVTNTQEGTVYITEKGKVQYIDYTGTFKPVKLIGNVVNRFHPVGQDSCVDIF